MAHPGWRRFLFARSQLMLLALALIGLAAGISFVNLGIAYNAASAANRTAHAQLAEAQQQQAMLIQALNEAEQDAHITPKAYDYFAQTPPGVTTVLIKPVVSGAAADQPDGQRSGPPFWGDWWERLVNP